MACPTPTGKAAAASCSGAHLLVQCKLVRHHQLDGTALRQVRQLLADFATGDLKAKSPDLVQDVVQITLRQVHCFEHALVWHNKVNALAAPPLAAPPPPLLLAPSPPAAGWTAV